MGQGTESCGGYDHEYDEYEEGLSSGVWTQRGGVDIKISNMTVKHLHGALAVARRASRNASFSCDTDKWDEWVELLENEIESRPRVTVAKKAKAVTKTSRPRGAKVLMKCHCGSEYTARKADINRGWGLSCSKSCAAVRRDFGRPAGKPVVTDS